MLVRLVLNTWPCDLPISASQSAGIISVSHCTQLLHTSLTFRLSVHFPHSNQNDLLNQRESDQCNFLLKTHQRLYTVLTPHCGLHDPAFSYYPNLMCYHFLPWPNCLSHAPPSYCLNKARSSSPPQAISNDYTPFLKCSSPGCLVWPAILTCQVSAPVSFLS